MESGFLADPDPDKRTRIRNTGILLIVDASMGQIVGYTSFIMVATKSNIFFFLFYGYRPVKFYNFSSRLCNIATCPHVLSCHIDITR